MAIALAGCDTDGITSAALKANSPLSPQLVAEIEQKNMTKDSPILVRIFKEEAELEVWKQDRTGRYARLKTFPICRWSGELGPKVKEGDRQAPEGFYAITPGQMNPNSAYYLAFNIGYPNAYDRSLGHTGSELMVHGDCSSRGCYAMTDEQIGQIYALARESFFGGQRAFQVQAYPFRMTPLNMAKHRNNPNMPFWKMLKVGYDHFEVTHLEPKVNVCERHYVFDAEAPAGSTTPVSFNASSKCPAYQIPEDIVAAVTEKQKQDEIQTAELISNGTPLAPIRTGTDGGMNPVFLAALNNGQASEGTAPGDILRALAPVQAPGTIPPTVNPPGPMKAIYTVSNDAPRTAAPARPRATSPKSTPGTLVASAEPGAVGQNGAAASGGLFDRMSNFIGLRGANSAPAAEAPAPAKAKRPAAAAHPQAKPTAKKPKSATVVPPAKPAEGAPSKVAAFAKAEPAAKGPPLRGTAAADGAAPTTTAMEAPPATMIRGAQPVVPVGSFEGRWTALR